MNIFVKVVISLITLGYGIGPLVADLNHTHVFHPDWTPHSKVHTLWFLVFAALISFLALYQLWAENKTRQPILFALFFLAGFWVAYFTAPFYGGALTDDGGVDQYYFGTIEANFFEFTIMTIVMVAALIWDLRRSK